MKPSFGPKASTPRLPSPTLASREEAEQQPHNMPPCYVRCRWSSRIVVSPAIESILPGPLPRPGWSPLYHPPSSLFHSLLPRLASVVALAWPPPPPPLLPHLFSPRPPPPPPVWTTMGTPPPRRKPALPTIPARTPEGPIRLPPVGGGRRTRRGRSCCSSDGKGWRPSRATPRATQGYLIATRRCGGNWGGGY